MPEGTFNLKVIECRDASYEASNGSAFDLFVSLCGTHIALAVYQTGSMYMLAFEYHPDVTDISSVLSGSELARNTYKSVGIIHDHPVASLVPKELYNVETSAQFLAFEHSAKEEKDGRIAADQLLTIKAVNVYRCTSSRLGAALDHFHGASLIHLHSIWLERFMLETNEGEIHNWILVESGYFLLSVKKDGKLLLFNRFEYETDEDLLYYVIYALEQHGIDAVDSKLTVFGFIQKSERLYALLKQYFKEVETGQRPESINFSNSFDKLPSHHHYPLFSGPLCV